MRIFVLLSALWFSACAPAADPALLVRAFEPETSRVFGAGTPSERFLVCQAERNYAELWTPTQADIAMLEPVLIELIEYRLAEDNLTYEDASNWQPTGYHRDYFGVIRGGQRFILVCGEYGRTPYFVFDGGPSRFAALFDVRRRTFTWFQFGYRA